jgi:4-hydroxythreonine-4-phosphate dehydrogenase
MQTTLLLTAGEPAGIGPDISLMQAAQPLDARLVCIADAQLLRERAAQLNLPVHINPLQNIEDAGLHQPGTLDVLPVQLAEPVETGRLNPANAGYVLQCLDLAVQLISAQAAHALVTGPVHKGAINDAGIAFTGHTEYLAQLTDSDPVMMLAADQLRVALATTHLPLSQVSAAITRPLLSRVIGILHRDLVVKFAISQPKILVAGLNPHAGEGGHLGREEIEIIEPVLNDLRNQGMKLIGPLPADTLFTPRYLQDADAVLAMYHDQGLPVLKHVGFGAAVNITLGLPIIRTSVDHGTATDLAGTGRVESGSLSAAIEQALLISKKCFNLRH